jgi:hypothetical protein
MPVRSIVVQCNITSKEKKQRRKAHEDGIHDLSL